MSSTPSLSSLPMESSSSSSMIYFGSTSEGSEALNKEPFADDFSGDPTAVKQFRSLLPYNTCEEGIEQEPPPNVAPFFADVLVRIFLFISLELGPCHKETSALAVAQTCKMWRYYANFLPHWCFARMKWTYSGGNNKIATGIIFFHKKLNCYQSFDSLRLIAKNPPRIGPWRFHRTSLAQRIWAPIVAILFLMANLGVSVLIGIGAGKTITSDIVIGIVTWVVVCVMIIFEGLIWVWQFIENVATKVADKLFLQFMMLLVFTFLFSVVFTLAGARVKELSKLADRGAFKLLPTTNCDALGTTLETRSRSVPSIIELPHQLNAPEWNLVVGPVTYNLLDDANAHDNVVTFFALNEYNSAMAEVLRKSLRNATCWWFDAQNGGVMPAVFAVPGNHSTTVFPSSSLLYRSVIYSARLDASKDFAFPWFSPENVAWAQNGIPLLNPFMPQTVDGLETKLRNYVVALGLISAFCIAMMVIPGIITVFVRHLKPFVLLWYGILVILANPIVMLAFGIACIAKGGESDALMCNNGSGWIIVVGSVLYLFLVMSLLCKIK